MLFAPDGQMLVEDDVSCKQKTSIKLIVDLSGNHLLEVRPLDEAVAGHYQVQIKEMRTATEQDINCFAAEKTLAEGMQLYKERTVESLQKAIAKFQEAFSLWHTVGNLIEEARSLNNIGAVYNALGEKQQALEYYNQALPLWRSVGDYPGLAATLNNIGKVHNALGEKQLALEYYNQALPLWKSVEDAAGFGVTLTNIGSVYSDLGEKQQALEYYNQALPLRHSVGDFIGEAVTLNNIGSVYCHLGVAEKVIKKQFQGLTSYSSMNRDSFMLSISSQKIIFNYIRMEKRSIFEK